MRKVVVILLITSGFSLPAAAQQARSGAAPASSPKACSLLTKDLALKVTGTNKALFDMPPREMTIGNGSECNWGDIQLRIDPFSSASLEGMGKNDKKWSEVSGVGDKAYFRENGRFAELMSHVGARTFTIQLGVPVTSTAEKIKPNVITLANAIVPRLK